MKISCPHCHSAFALDDKRVPPAGLSIKCPKCKQPFAIHPTKPGEEGKIVEGKPLAPRKPSQPPAPPPLSAGGSESVGEQPSRTSAPPAEPEPGHTEPTQAAGLAEATAGIGHTEPTPEVEHAAPTPEGEESAPAPEAGHAEHAPEETTSPISVPPSWPPPETSGLPAAEAPSWPQVAESLAAPAAATASWPQVPGASDFTGAASLAASDGTVPLPGAAQELRGGPLMQAHEGALPLPGQESYGLQPPVGRETPLPLPGQDDTNPFAEPLPLPGEDSVVAVSGGVDPFAHIDFGDGPSAPAPASAPQESPPAEEEDPFRVEPASSFIPQPGPEFRSDVLELAGASPPAPAAPHVPVMSPPDDGMSFDFVNAPSTKPVHDEMLNFVEEPAQKAAAKPTWAPPIITPTGVPQPPAAAQEERSRRQSTRSAKREQAKPLSESLASIAAELAKVRRSPKLLSAIVGALALVAGLVAGIRAGNTSAGIFWKNRWTSAGKLQSNAARDAIEQGKLKLAEGTFASAREALAIAARTLAAQPDDERARTFLVLCASEMKIGWGATGADWDQATRLIEKLTDLKPDVLRAKGAHALASGALAKARPLLTPLGEKPDAELESVWLQAQLLLRGGDPAKAALVLDGALKARPQVKLLLLRGLVERARGKPEEGARFFEQALALSPGCGRALVESAELKLDAGDLTAVAALLERIQAPEVMKQLDASEEGRSVLLRARLLAQQHQGKQAEAQFERAVTLDTNSAEVHAQYGQFRLQRREYQLAAKQLEQALLIDGSNPLWLGLATQAELGNSSFLDADKHAREALAKDANNAHLIYISGKVAESIGKGDEAAREFERALTKKPDLAEALIAQGRIAAALGDKEKVRARAEAAQKSLAASRTPLDLEGAAELWMWLGDFSKAEEDAAQAQQLDPEDPWADLAMGRARAALGDLPAARASFEKALARVDGDLAMHYEYGSLLRRAGDLPGARKELERAIAIDPKDALSHARLGAVLVEQNDPVAAEVQLRQAVVLRDHLGEALYFLGRALAMQKKLQDAIDMLRKATEIEPDNGTYLYQLGLVYEGGTQLNEAVVAFTHSTQKSPKNADAFEHLGLVLLTQNIFGDAVTAFEKAARLVPERASVWAELGETFQQMNDLDGAIANFQKSVKLDDKQAQVWVKLGIAYKDQGCDGCKAKAIDALTRATKLAPKDATAFHELGYIYKDDRKRALAMEAFQRYLELKPNANDAESVKDDIFYLQQEGKRAP